MSSEQILLVMTAVLAVVALAAAFIAVRAARRSAASPQSSPVSDHLPVPLDEQSAPQRVQPSPATEAPVARIVEGRVIVPPTNRQVVDATLGKPLVRISVFSHGVAHALRPESRDRIVALMRREFRSRRRQRKRAAKQAARLANPTPPRPIDRSRSQVTLDSEAWLGELPATPPKVAEQ